MPEAPHRLLFLSTAHPFPQDSGWNLRTLNVLEACAEVGRVTYVGPAPAGGSVEDTLGRLCERVVLVETHAAPAGPLEVLRAALRYRALTGPGTISRLRPYAEALRELPPSSFDLIWSGQPWLALLAAAAPSRTVVDMVDVEHLKAARRLRAARAGRWRTALHMTRLWWIEVLGLRRYRACVVSSPEDHRYLRRWRVGNVTTVPNAIRVPQHPVRRAPGPPALLRLVFLGQMGYWPNVDAVNHLIRDVLPLVKREWPQVTLDVIGPQFPEALRSELPPEVRVRGFVDDLSSALAGYDLFVSPLRLGGGTKLKVLTALAHGIPLVTTPVGAEGLGLVPGRHATVCRSPEELAAAIVDLGRHPQRAQEMAAQARRLVEERLAGWRSGSSQTRRPPTRASGPGSFGRPRRSPPSPTRKFWPSGPSRGHSRGSAKRARSPAGTCGCGYPAPEPPAPSMCVATSRGRAQGAQQRCSRSSTRHPS
jgi:glycosyltransferase involved in cell wall biosynthesis